MLLRAELEQLKRRQTELMRQLTILGLELRDFQQRVASVKAAEVQSPQPTVPPKVAPPPIPVVSPALPAQPPRVEVQPTQISEPPREAIPEVLTKSPLPETVVFARQTNEVPTPLPALEESRQEQTVADEPPARKSFEMQLGTYWLVRIGIVMLVTGLVFFGTYAYQNYVGKIGPAGKISLLYAASGALMGLGIWLHHKEEKLRNYAQVLLAGGMAAVYFTTYGAHYIPQLLVLPSALVDGVLLLAWAAFVIWFANRHKSEVLALFAVLLAYYTSIITHVGLFTLYSNLVLTGAAVFFLVRNRWATLSFASLVATYVSYAFWRFYQNGEWHWTAAEGGLWAGICFLASYWALFTVAVFLSRHEQFDGGRRASFLSLNNGAFFAGYVLTIQPGHGGFWKFCLVFGAMLLVLSALARRWLAQDGLFSNAFLTQGVLLATLGLITYYEGLRLSLVLAAESVVLVTVGREMKSRVLSMASLIAAALAAARCWVTTATEPVGNHELTIGCSVGAMILFNAFWRRRETDFIKSIRHLPTVGYTSLALAVWLTVIWRDAQPDWRGLVLAGVSLALVFAARPLQNRILALGAYLFAGAGAVWEEQSLGREFNFHDLHPPTGLLQVTIMGALMVAGAAWEQRNTQPREGQKVNPAAAFFSVVGLLLWALATCAFAPSQYLAPLLAVETLAFTASYYPLRLAEVTVFGQLFLLLAQALWLRDATVEHVTRPWWNAGFVILCTLGQAAWWQRQKTLMIQKGASVAFQALGASMVVALFYFWLQPQFPAPGWLAFTSLLAILLTVYAMLNRFWLLAATGQIFMVLSVWEFGRQLLEAEPFWYVPLAPIAALCVLSLGTLRWFASHGEASETVRGPIVQIALLYRIVAVTMSLWWFDKYVPARENCWALVLMGTALFAAAGWRRNRELLIFSAVYTLIALIRFVVAYKDAPTVYWPNLPALLAVLVQQQIAGRRPERYRAPKPAHICAIIVGGLSLWLLLSRWILEQSDGFYLTAGWSVLALLFFVAGMILRERVYRWLGLGILACAMGRVVIFDVWRLETIYRILSFMALGVVLLVLGFIYNKYQEKIKEWL